MPHLNVEDGALNLLLKTYTELLPTNGFLTHKAKLDTDRFERFVAALAVYRRRSSNTDLRCMFDLWSLHASLVTAL